MNDQKRFILTLSCTDVKGIVSAVSGFLVENDCFIIDSAQFGDPITNRFFMRTEFRPQDKTPALEELKNNFTSVGDKFGMEWRINDTSVKHRALIMVSKQSHCLNDLLHRYKTGTLPIDVAGVASNHKDLEEIANWYKIPFYHLPITKETKMEQEAEIWKLVQKLNIDLVILARYMQILSSSLTAKLAGRAINIHHSFLPSFKGAKPYHQAYDRGVKIIGATAHYVTDDLDEGPIIEQEVIRVDHARTPKQLVSLGQDIESLVLTRAVIAHIEDRILINGNKTVVF